MSDNAWWLALAFLLGLVFGHAYGKAQAMGILRGTIDAMKADRDALATRIATAESAVTDAKTLAAKAAEDLAQAQANALDPAEVAELQTLEKEFRAMATSPSVG